MLAKGSTTELNSQPSPGQLLLISLSGSMSVAHACNPSFSGGRDQEAEGSKPAQANSLRDPILKKKNH
jgi:hypothetical protein